MASLAFLLAPLSTIPAQTDPVWYADVRGWGRAVDDAWAGMHRRLDAEMQRRVPRQLENLLPRITMTVVGAQQRGLESAAEAWTNARFEELRAGDFSGPMPVISASAASAALGRECVPGLDALTHYRGGELRPVAASKLKCGAQLGYLANAASPWAFNVFNGCAPERTALRIFAQAYGGDYLALVTWGSALMVERICSPSPGVAPTVDDFCAVRLTPLAREGREAGTLASLRSLFHGSQFKPDFDAIARELAAPRIGVPAFFAAFGMTGAREIEPPDAAANWAQFDAVCTALLAGEPAPKAALAAVNALLAESGAKLPGKPPRAGKGLTARALAHAYAALKERVPEPMHGVWPERAQVAQTVWALDASPAGRSMTFGHGAKGMGPSAAAARMLAHVAPARRAGDPMALSLLSLECEAANWHGFVEPLAALAETSAETGFSAVVVPVSERGALDAGFGLEVDKRPDRVPAPTWTGEVFLDGPALVKGDARAALVAWMRKRKTSGAVVHVAADGSVVTTYFADGREVARAAEAGLPDPDLPALRQARADFDVRAVHPALGVGDLLAPGDLTPDVAPRGRDNETRRTIDAVLATLPPPVAVSGWRRLVEDWGGEVRLTGYGEPYEGEPPALRLRVPGADGGALLSLRNDLRGEDLADYGDAWRHADEELRAQMDTDYYTQLLVLVLGDTPAGSELGLTLGDAPPIHWVLQGATTDQAT